MTQIAYLVLILLVGSLQQDVERERSKVVVRNTNVIAKPTLAPIDAGPVVGDMLNAHYFPGIVYYNSGYYSNANAEFTYVVERPQYLEDNPRKGQYLSTSYYLRGTIYLDHADGVGRYSLARADFEQALKWNPNNHQVYIDLGRLYSTLGFRDQAISTIQYLLDLKPDETIATFAREQLEAIKNPDPTISTLGSQPPSRNETVPNPTISTAGSQPPSRNETVPNPTISTAGSQPPSRNETVPNPTISTAGSQPPSRNETVPNPTISTARSQPPSRNETVPNAAATPTTAARTLVGKISINSTLPADIYSGNKYVGSTPATIEFPAGMQTLEYRYQNLTKSTTYVVKADETLKATVTFDVAMDLNAQPWAEVFLAGSNTPLGQTPLSGVQVTVGSSLVFRHPSFPEKHYKVTATDRSVSIAFP